MRSSRACTPRRQWHLVAPRTSRSEPAYSELPLQHVAQAVIVDVFEADSTSREFEQPLRRRSGRTVCVPSTFLFAAVPSRLERWLLPLEGIGDHGLRPRFVGSDISRKFAPEPEALSTSEAASRAHPSSLARPAAPLALAIPRQLGAPSKGVRFARGPPLPCTRCTCSTSLFGRRCCQ